MNNHMVKKRAFDYFNSGFNCAEAVFRTIVEIKDEAESKDLTRIASAFAGGVGGTHDELCGALAGGIMAIGFLIGRKKPGEDIQSAKNIASSLRRSLLDKYGYTKCQDILDKIGPQENSIKCKELTGDLAGELYNILEEKGFFLNRDSACFLKISGKNNMIKK